MRSEQRLLELVHEVEEARGLTFNEALDQVMTTPAGRALYRRSLDEKPDADAATTPTGDRLRREFTSPKAGKSLLDSEQDLLERQRTRCSERGWPTTKDNLAKALLEILDEDPQLYSDYARLHQKAVE